jgi:hypothetical protein
MTKIFPNLRERPRTSGRGTNQIWKVGCFFGKSESMSNQTYEEEEDEKWQYYLPSDEDNETDEDDAEEEEI